LNWVHQSVSGWSTATGASTQVVGIAGAVACSRGNRTHPHNANIDADATPSLSARRLADWLIY
jgi:hypothetical protein